MILQATCVGSHVETLLPTLSAAQSAMSSSHARQKLVLAYAAFTAYSPRRTLRPPSIKTLCLLPSPYHRQPTLGPTATKRLGFMHPDSFRTRVDRSMHAPRPWTMDDGWYL